MPNKPTSLHIVHEKNGQAWSPQSAQFTSERAVYALMLVMRAGMIKPIRSYRISETHMRYVFSDSDMQTALNAADDISSLIQFMLNRK